ncbi:hypothetical protein TNCV_1965321 [Trichonephila clavipes]|nr:hypothetical protein TNCV_1965321 [Trichonephila clavipes]
MAGYANWRIARLTGLNDAAIRRFWQEWVENGRFQRHGSGRPRATAVFSGEFRFQLCPDDHRRRVWRRPSQRANPAFNIACDTGTQPGVLV